MKICKMVDSFSNISFNKTMTDDIIQGEINKIKLGLEKSITGLTLR